MKIQYKLWKDDGGWKTTTSMKVLEKEISKLGRGVHDIIEIRMPCDHKNTYIDSGIKVCKTCGEHLEVTSYRD
jgi:hypothetical protein